MSTKATITGIRTYFPEKVVTNKDLEKLVDTNDEWIVERTGIKERRMGNADETPGYMGSLCAKKILEDFKIAPEEIDVIVVATVTPDYHFPATACIVQNAIGATNAFAFDVGAACSGYLYSLEICRSFIESGRAKNILLIAAEKMSAILDFTDRNTCILFGDAGSASLIQVAKDDSTIIDSVLKTDGSGVENLLMPKGGSKDPLTEENFHMREHFAKQNGTAVFKRAVKDMADISLEVLKRNNLTGDDIALYVPHQANIRILDVAAKRMGLPKEKVAINLDRYGNTTAATIPTALQENIENGRVKKGDLILLASFGAGYTWGSTLLRL
jgi:3-oxoacyl-[acyl-carrier-protein] synthase-3